MSRHLVVDFVPEGLLVRLAAVSGTHAVGIRVLVAQADGTLSGHEAFRCEVDAETGEPCRVMGGLSTHVTHPDLLPGLLGAFQTGGQEGLFLHLEGLL